MFVRLEAADREWRAALAEFDARALTGTQPSEALDVIINHQRATAAAKATVVRRLDEMLQWKRQGYDSFEDYLAATEGTSTGSARRKAKAARDMADNDKVADALADGDISEDEAEVVADAAAKNPDATDDLLDTAKNRHKSHNDLKDRAAAAKAAGESDRARSRRLRNGRSGRCGTNRDGFWTMFTQQQPHIGAEVQSVVDAEVDRQLARARKAGLNEPIDRYRADAIARLILGRQPDTHGAPADADLDTTEPTADTDPDAPKDCDPSRAGADVKTGNDRDPSGQGDADPESATGDSEPISSTTIHKELILDINLQTYRRGRVLSGETCTIRGIGPVPVEIAHLWAEDAFIKAVIRDGVDVKTVVHYGRHLPATVRTALGVIEQACAVPGCSNPRVEYDHDHTVADHGPTCTDNLRPLCVRHHRLRTHHGYELTGPPGDRRWIGPDGTTLFADDPERIPSDQPPVGLFDPDAVAEGSLTTDPSP